LKSPLLAKEIARLALTKKAADVVIMDLRGLTSVADFFVVCSGDSDPQIRAIADAVDEGLEQKGTAVWHKESGSPNWVLLDYVDVVVHVFHKNTRAFYSLEKLWGDAKMQRVEDEATHVRKPAVRRTPAARRTAAAGRKPAVRKKRAAAPAGGPKKKKKPARRS
jgi:ribosome-associated protein